MTNSSESRTLRRSATHWGALTAEVRGGRLSAVRPFARDPNPSSMLRSIPEAVYHPSRIAQPAVRAGWLAHGPGGGGAGRGAQAFVPVSWDEALDLVAGELRRVKAEPGNQAIYGGSYGWASAGRFHQANAQLYRFLNGFGGFTEKADSYSFAAGTVVMQHVVGTKEVVVGPITDWHGIVRDTRLMVMFGGLPLKNTQVEYGGTGQHMAEQWLRRAKQAGVEFVGISPLRDDTPNFLEAQWIAPRPNTDTAVLLGVAHTLVAEGRHDRAFLERYCVGFDRFLPYLMGRTDGEPKDADWAASISGVDAHTIRRLARRMSGTRTLITMTWSLQRGDHGEQPYWMAAVLAAMLGQIGLPGGGFGFGYACESGMGTPRQWISVPTLPIGENPTGSFIPVARLADMLLQPGEAYRYNGADRVYPDIRLVYWAGGNPFHHHQDLNRLVRAWQRPDTVIVHEPWWTAAARHADIVLPATTPFERNDLAASSRDRFILAMQQAIEPVGQARNDFDIFAALAERLGFADAFTEGRNEGAWIRHLYETTRDQAMRRQVRLPEFEAFWRRGYVEVPAPATPYVIFEDFRRNPARFPLATPSGRIEIYSETIAGFGDADCPPHPAWLEPAEWLGAALADRYPLHLVSNQPRSRLHGQLDMCHTSRAGKVRGREPVWMHADDAGARGIADGDIVRVFNDRGEVLAGARLTDAIRPGVVQLATGAWYDPAEPGRVGSLDKHGNANVLTLDKGTSRLAQAPVAHTALVQVERYDGPLPEITAFDPPPLATSPG
jgi:biotin/methionine sulfoxide reductase